MYLIAYIDRVEISVAAAYSPEGSRAGHTTSSGSTFRRFAYTYAALQIIGGWLSDPRWGLVRVLRGLSLALAFGRTDPDRVVVGSVTSLVVFRLLGSAKVKGGGLHRRRRGAASVWADRCGRAAAAYAQGSP